MDWGTTDDPQQASFADMDFTFDDDDLFDFGPSNDMAPQFEATMFDTTDYPFSNSGFQNIQLVDPALISPESDTEPSGFGPVGDAGIELAQPQQRQQKSRRRAEFNAKYMPPGLFTNLSIGSRRVHGQITPPSSDTSSPSQPALDTIDPTAVMPMTDALRPDIDGLDLPADPQLLPPAPASPPKEAPAPEPESQVAGPAPSDPPAKPKSKRGRKKKILAPAARDAQRARTLARNRAAAQRCRQRKKVEHGALEAKARTLTKERARLTMMVGSLRDELLSLKGAMLSHAGCAEIDGNVARYVREQREMLMAGMPLESEGPNPSHSLLDETYSEDHYDESEEESGQEEDEGEGEDAEGEDGDEMSLTAEPPPSRSPAASAAVAHRTRSHRQQRN
jgi:bZIP transcription factor